MLKVLGADGAGAFDGGGGEGVVGYSVDKPKQPAGALEQRLDGRRLEQGGLATGETQAVGEVVVEFIALDAWKIITHDDVL